MKQKQVAVSPMLGGEGGTMSLLSPLLLTPPQSPSQPPTLPPSPPSLCLLPPNSAATLTISLEFSIIVNLMVCTEANPLSGIMVFFTALLVESYAARN